MNIWSNLLLIGCRKYTKIDHSYIVNATIKYLLDSVDLGTDFRFFVYF